MVKLKICGIKTVDDIEIINNHTPDYIGFVFAKSKRQIDFETAKTLKNHLKVDIPIVGVFVDSPINEIIKLYKNNIINIAQLHGNENKEYINQLKSLEPNLELIKAIEIKGDGNLEKYERLNVDYLLLDSGKGSGKTFNWDLIDKNLNKRFFLAGGLNKDNIKNAIKQFKPYAVDLSSGVEVDGIKNNEKIKEIMGLI